MKNIKNKFDKIIVNNKKKQKIKKANFLQTI